jgi:hypothetical protein
MDKKKLAAEACKAIGTIDIAVSVFELINEYHGYPPTLTRKGNVFLVKFDAETEAFDGNGFVKFVKDQVGCIYDMEEIAEYGDVFEWEDGFHNELYKLLKIK